MNTLKIVLAGLCLHLPHAGLWAAVPGDLKWECYVAPRLNVKPTMPAVTLNGEVYVCTEDNLTSIDAQGQATVLNSTDYAYLFESPPMLGSQGMLYFTTGSKDNDKYHLGRRVFAVDMGQQGGKILWATSQEGSKFVVSPGIGPDGTIYAADEGGVLHAYRNTDGQTLWNHNAPVYRTHRETAPVVGPDGTIYYARNEGSYGNVVYAIRPDGSRLWSRNISRSVTDSTYALAFGPNRALYASTFCGVQALDANDGEPRWFFEAKEVQGDVVTGPDGTAYFGDEDWYLHAVSPNGQELWKLHVEGSIRTAAAVAADGTVYFGTYSGYLHAARWEAGRVVEKWQLYGGGHVLSAPAIGADGTVYFSATAGYVYAIHGSAGPALSIWPMARQNAQRTGLCPMSPTIREQPRGTNVVAGGTGTVSAVVSGGPPLAYQWFKDGRPVPGATQAALTLSQAQATQSGYYSLEVSNYLGRVRSDEAALTVGPEPLAAKIAVCRMTNSLHLRVLGTVGKTCHVEVNDQSQSQGWQSWKTFGFGPYAEHVVDAITPAQSGRYYRVKTLR